MMQKTWKMTEMLAYGYSSESASYSMNTNNAIRPSVQQLWCGCLFSAHMVITTAIYRVIEEQAK